MKTFIKFENQELNKLRSNLLKDLSKEYYAILYGKSNFIDDVCIITVKDIVYYNDHYLDQTVVSINIDSSFRAYCLEEISNRLDVDTIIDVHTHPFSSGMPYFSGVDTNDEIEMKEYLVKKGDNIHYASIVFSRDMYNARIWEYEDGKVFCENAFIKTQKVSEMCGNIFYEKNTNKDESKQLEMFNRSILALGVETIKTMMKNQVITIVGVGGVGSIIAENLVHMGFQKINLVDFDKVEISNLNRLVGATYNDAVNHVEKVKVIARHLKEINPFISVRAYSKSVFESEIEKVIATSDWVFMTTDNYSSCVHIQDLCFKYYVPFISAATNIIVENNEILDVRGEVLLIRMGDRMCLNCLGKIDKKELIYETHPDPKIREELVQKGYVRGADVKDPAVKTLNAMVSTIATDVLINQYTERQKDQFVIEFENNSAPLIYEDLKCIRNRKTKCHICGGYHD